MNAHSTGPSPGKHSVSAVILQASTGEPEGFSTQGQKEPQVPLRLTGLVPGDTGDSITCVYLAQVCLIELNSL